MKAIKTYSSYKNSDEPWLREVPEHWEIIKAKRIFIESSVKGFPNEPLLAATQTKGVIPKSMYENTTVTATKNFESLKLVEKGDFVISLRSFQGGIEYAHFRGIISTAYTILKPTEEVIHDYYRYLLKSKRYISGLKLLVTGIREGQNIDTTKFKNSYLPLPPEKEQAQIANFLDYNLAKINRFIRKKKQLIKLLNEQKAAVINQAVTKGLDPNVPMRDSGIEWLGEIPEHWQVRKLKYVANCFPSNIDKHSKDNEAQVRLCNYTDVYKNDFITNDMELMLATATDDQIEKFSLLKGDVIITKDSETADDIANPALVIEELENVVCGYHLSVIRPYSKLIGSYLLRALQCKVINAQFEVCSNGVTRVGLGVYDMRSAKIPLPPKKEQVQIVKFIEKEVEQIQKTISTIEKEITLTQEYKTALIAEAVTGKIDVRDFVIPDVNEEQESYEDPDSYRVEEELNMVAEDDPSYQNEALEE